MEWFASEKDETPASKSLRGRGKGERIIIKKQWREGKLQCLLLHVKKMKKKNMYGSI